MSAAPTLARVEGPKVVLHGRTIPIVLPKLSDPRLKLSAVILTLTVLGQTLLSFQVSVPQILVCVLLGAAFDIVMTYRSDHVLIWPASGIQTGISVAFIFRVGGTRHGDLWSVRGLHIFALVMLLSMVSKYVLRREGRHIFNPSNIGLAWALLVIGPSHVFSEHLWWGPLGPAVIFSMAVIFVGGWWVLRQVKMIPMAVTYLATFGTLIALLALSGRTYWATWHVGSVGGSFYWVTVALSPELLIFVFFMISDPRTAPLSQLGRHLYAFTTATVAALLTAVQTTEFGIKLAILSSLVVACALVPVFDRAAARVQDRRSGAPPRPWLGQPVRLQLRSAVRNPVSVAVLVIAVAALTNTALLARNDQIPIIERNLTSRNVQ